MPRVAGPKSSVRQRPRSPAPAVLVTGASGGIGRAIGLAFAQQGYALALHYHRNKPAAETTRTLVQEAGGHGTLYQADLREFEQVRQMIDASSRACHNLSTFVCCAGIAASGLLLRLKESDWVETLAANLTGTFHCLRAMAGYLMTSGGGSIVVIGSYAGFQGSVGQAAYAASKAGLIGLVKTAALEWGPDNIRVNIVLPGWQRTVLSQGAMPDDRDWSDHALRRSASLAAVARTVVHLAQLSDVSGQVWNCDSRSF